MKNLNSRAEKIMGSNVLIDVDPAHVIAGNPAKILRNDNPPHIEPLFGE